jgi:hypothetical protein
MNNRLVYLSVAILFVILSSTQLKAQQQELRAPAYPLITVDPNFSIWSMGDTLYNTPTKHWTEEQHSLQGIVRVDGKSYSFLGKPVTEYETQLPMSEKNDSEWSFTTSTPENDWKESQFDDREWERGIGAFQDGEKVQNPWNTREVWARRTFEINDLDAVNIKNLLINIYHDDGAEVYINGVLALESDGVTRPAATYQINQEALDTIKEGKNVIAAHSTNTGGLAYLDVGLVEQIESNLDITNANQTDVDLTATKTSYRFDAGPIELKTTFTAPLLPDNLELISRPANYISFEVSSNDGQAHDVQVYLSAASNIAVNTPEQEVVLQRMPSRKLDVMRVGTSGQQVLGRKGDNVRIDWGYLYLASASGDQLTTRIAADGPSKKDFIDDGTLSDSDDSDIPREVQTSPVTLATAFNFGNVNGEVKSHHTILAYDDIYSIEYFNEPLQAWWKKDSSSIIEMLETSESQYDSLMTATEAFDNQLREKAITAGGKKYAELTELAYRQSIAAHKLVASPSGKPLYFSKENNSNGSIGTVDVTYPSSPLFLYYNPELLKGMLRPIFYYRESGRWDEPFAAHDVGTYPIANGQTYGGDMPVEESGNMLIMATAIAQAEGNAEFAKNHWQSLTEWANYLMENGMDPKNQLSTDDFAGHLARNANLSIKAILGIYGYGRLAEMLGKDEVGAKYRNAAKDMAKKWETMADAGDHYMLAFGNPDTWSQKYNLAWDDILDFNIFSDKINQTEIEYYLSQQNEFGLPLDNRAKYTKSDWIMWTATLTEDQETFDKFIDPMYRAFDETTDRVPMTDWYWTNNGDQRGFKARSVVGGYFMKMLEEKMSH